MASLNKLVVRSMASAWLLLCITFGGSSDHGFVANGFLQIFAGAIIFVFIQRRSWSTFDQPARTLCTIALGFLAFIAVTLVPLPSGLWRLLPGRSEIFDAYALIKMPEPWLSISMTPDATTATLFAFLPPLAMLVLVYASPPQGRWAAVIVLAAAAFASVLFGVVQQVSGYGSNTYLYQYTSRGGAVGFFANRNHLATLCLATMPFLAALAVPGLRKQDWMRSLGWLPAVGALLLLVVGALVVQSRAGWLLLPPTLLGCVLLMRRAKRAHLSRTLITATAIVVVVAILAVLFAPVTPTDIKQVGGEVSPQERRAIMGLTWQAALHFFPVGTGLGSFVQIYPRFENSLATTNTFINHAHNDYLEFLLETGIFGVAFLLAFVTWWVVRIREVWRQGGDPIARAATVSIGVIAAHSFVDYPIRTAAVACVAALCCGLASTCTHVAAPPRRRERERTNMIMLGTKARPGHVPGSAKAL